MQKPLEEGRHRHGNTRGSVVPEEKLQPIRVQIEARQPKTLDGRIAGLHSFFLRYCLAFRLYIGVNSHSTGSEAAVEC